MAAIKEACELVVSTMTIHRYLKYANLDRTLAKRKVYPDKIRRLKVFGFLSLVAQIALNSLDLANRLTMAVVWTAILPTRKNQARSNFSNSRLI